MAVLQLGLVLLFAAVAPFAAALLLFGLCVRLRAFVFNLCMVHQRALPRLALAGLQRWQRVLFVLLLGACVCNAGLLAFVSQTLLLFVSSITLTAQLAAFVIYLVRARPCRCCYVGCRCCCSCFPNCNVLNDQIK